MKVPFTEHLLAIASVRYSFQEMEMLLLNVTEINECDNELSEKELYMFFMSMQNNASPGNGGLTNDFFIIL